VIDSTAAHQSDGVYRASVSNGSSSYGSVEEIALAISRRLSQGLDEEVQNEMASLLILLPELSSTQHRQLIPLAEVAVAALLADKPNVVLVRHIREDLEARIHRSPLLHLLRGGGTPPTLVILGLGTLLYFAIPFLVFYGRQLLGQELVFGVESAVVALVALSGALGSIVSIMVRIRDFGSSQHADPSILFFTGFFKPVIGTAFALFVFAVLKAGILPIALEVEKSHFFFAALAFVSGFSERFASDVATRTEDVVRSTTHLA
jgi:hypothetical protein